MTITVALCEEGVDRNLKHGRPSTRRPVALCEEGVDRNFETYDGKHGRGMSPSAKRAWIEIVLRCATITPMTSPSAKRAWIEIFAYVDVPCGCCVALCEEGVDRNRIDVLPMGGGAGRPLRRGRG